MKLISTSICAEWKFTAVPIVILKPLICRLDPWECDGIFPVSKSLCRRLHPRECHGIFLVSKPLCRRLHPRECHGISPVSKSLCRRLHPREWDGIFPSSQLFHAHPLQLSCIVDQGDQDLLYTFPFSGPLCRKLDPLEWDGIFPSSQLFQLPLHATQLVRQSPSRLCNTSFCMYSTPYSVSLLM